MRESYQLGLYEKAMPPDLSWDGRLLTARECGFDYVEISVDESDGRQARLDWTAGQRASLRDAVGGEGVPLGSMCLSGLRRWPLGSSDPATRARSLEMVDKALDLACDLGLRMIQIPGYDVYYEQSTERTRAWFAEGLARAVDMAAKAGVALGFETMETPFMDTVGKSMRYVSLVDSPYLGIYPDVGNLTNASLLYGTSVPDDIARGRGHILAAHLKETAPGRYREVPISTGTTDYDGALAQLVPLGVRRYVCEMWYLGSSGWRGDLAFASDFVRGKLDAAWGLHGS